MTITTLPPLVDLTGRQQYRIIPSVYPLINFFEDLVDPSEMEILWEIESLTNERLRQEAGDIFLVTKEDRISGPGSSVIMAAFTHIHKPSRFTDGTFGIYYSSLAIETAIKETIYNREIFLRSTNELACEISMRLYKGQVMKPLHDIRASRYDNYHNPTNYSESQLFGKNLKEQNSWGLIYNSVRHSSGSCIAALKPRCISIPKPTSHFRYVWNGKNITEVLDTKSAFVV